jgi:hypothetical protein
MLRTTALVLALAFTGIAAASAPPPPPPPGTEAPAAAEKKPADAMTKEECEAEGGTLQVAGLLNKEYCIIPYKDAGKACTDDDECEGQCWATDEPPGADGIQHGTCQPTNMPFGCNRNVVKGEALPVLCVD